MPGSLQNKLQQLEVAPPPSVWEKISQQLDNEFVPGDINISTKLDNASITAPTGMWDKINAELNDSITTKEQKRSKVIPLIYQKMAVAALIVGVLITAGLYFLNNNVPESNIVKTIPEKKMPPPIVQEEPKMPDSGSSIVVAQNDKKTKKYQKKSSAHAANDQENYINIIDESDLEYITDPQQAPLYELHTVSALQPVSVSAPPLRDKKGNIILDASLISKPDDEYIVVTGPNGKQTKISSKFLSCLGYINESLTSNDMDLKAVRCRTQFQEWRKKLLAEPAFIPTANNFFDIFELKDLIQEM
jgi:hypothetical protein